ncbi:S-adenosyl-L-methionine-dependent methyltransferase [Mycena filopes]|nr:S-adenosyl-L-methionine-dependent methyltransferase [Mycena filopes]
MQSPQPLSTLRLLADIINKAVETMETAYARDGHLLPSLDKSFDLKDTAESMRQDPSVATAVMDIIAAASQISATVVDPSKAVLQTALGFNISACLRVASELNMVETLRDAPRHIDDIAALVSVDPQLLAGILRLLAIHHIFREVSPDVFANNRMSSVLDKGKSVEDLLSRPREDRLIGSSGFAAYVEYLTDDGFTSATCLLDTVLAPQDGITPFNVAFKTCEPLYDWMQRPENTQGRKRFAVAMQGSVAAIPPESVFHAFDWKSLTPGSVVVDVGSGTGHILLPVAERYPELRVILQDLAPNMEEAKQYWTTHLMDHVDRGMVEFQAHDFFDAQPVKDADVFFLRHIMHNWSNARAIEILKNLRNAARPTTQLIIDDEIVPLTPLLPNWGTARAEPYLFNILMRTLLGGSERTLAGFQDVLRQAGWDLVCVHPRGRSLIAVPKVEVGA